ncbi:MAG: FxsA family protein [Planctomycetia bacterium]|nr:FxsA family protein [Planctomycetia bacterium]
MLGRLLLLLIIIPLVELFLLLQIAQHTSAEFAFALVIGSGVAGVLVIRWQNVRTWRQVQQELQANRMPGVVLVDHLLIFIAGVLLIIPGVLTDLCGMALLLPPVRKWVRGYMRRRFEARLNIRGGGSWHSHSSGRDQIIDSRVIDSKLADDNDEQRRSHE